MTSRALLILTATMLVVGCDRPQTSQPKQTITVRSEVQDQLHELNDLNRAIALKRAIYASGSTCRRVESSGYVQEYKNLSMWTARCDDRREWAIFVGPDGSAQVRLCRDVASVGLPACTVRAEGTQQGKAAAAG